ncbi:MAG: response regulator, partial [Proteobacteria bacterium]|nr:response regulator [Pseudomonadota bacterium]
MARILIIDDEDELRSMLRQMLEQAGHEVTEAVNGAEGIRLYEQDRPDLIITDIIMPEKEGVETIIALRRADPDLPIIAISGGGRLDATDFLT